MKQPGDSFTLDMLPAAAKRGRGRPPKDNALSDADRAKRYRQRKALKSQMAIKMQGMNMGQIGRMRHTAERFKKGSLLHSVLCEMTLSKSRFVPVTSP